MTLERSSDQKNKLFHCSRRSRLEMGSFEQKMPFDLYTACWRAQNCLCTDWCYDTICL